MFFPTRSALVGGRCKSIAVHAPGTDQQPVDFEGGCTASDAQCAAGEVQVKSCAEPKPCAQEGTSNDTRGQRECAVEVESKSDAETEPWKGAGKGRRIRQRPVSLGKFDDELAMHYGQGRGHRLRI